MEVVSSLIGCDWERLAYNLFYFQDTLKTKSKVIDELTKAGKPLYQTCFDMLNKWKMESENPTREMLIDALENIGVNRIVSELKRKYAASQ